MDEAETSSGFRTTEPTGAGIDPRARAIGAWLARVRRTAKGLLLVQRIGWIVGGAVAAVVIGGVLDYFLRSPAWLRGAGLAGAALVLALVILRRVVPALRFRPSLTEVALRVEGVAGADVGAAGVLASGLELGEGTGGAGGAGPARALAEPVIERAEAVTRRVRATDVFRPGGAIRAGAVAVASVLALLGLAAAEPGLTGTGLSRMLAPWAGAEWPKRTAIADATGVEHHPLGTALSIRGALLRSDRPAESTSVAAVYRVINGQTPGPARRVLLKDQPRNVAVQTPEGAATGTLFERLIEPGGLTPDGADAGGAAGASASDLRLEYWLETGDDRTPTRTVTLVRPPSVVRSTLSIELPAYAADLLGAQPGVSTPIDLGPGSDERAAPGPILTGSRVRMVVELNKPVPAPPVASPETLAAWAERSLGPEVAGLIGDAGAEASIGVEGDGSRWIVSWRHGRSVRVAVRPVDEYGIGAGEESVYRLDLMSDAPPTAVVTTPTEDRSVLPTAVVPLAGEGRDDVGLRSVSLERQIARRTGGSASPSAEPAQERVVLATQTADRGAGSDGAAKLLTVGHELDLSTLEVKPGDEVWITAVATDAFELDGAGHAPARSSVRKLRIMSRDQLVEQIWGELSGVRRSAIRMDQDQAEAKTQGAQDGQDSARRAERAQAQLSERLSRQAEAVRRLQQRARENALADAGVNQVLREAQEALERAGQRSTRAAQDLGESARAQAQENAGPEAGKAERERAAGEQEGVRDELSSLIDMLDQGEDTFASKRSLERLLEQQKALRERTEKAGAQTTGKAAEQLSAEQRAELEQIAQEQQATAEQLRDAVSKMAEREQKLRSNDPAAAQAMAQAARQTQRDQTPEKMQQAAEQARQNQTNNARQQQSQAIESLQEAIRQLDQAQNNRDEVLSRFLASLVDSIRGLIDRQKAEIAELTARQATADFAGLDAGMAALHQNTLGVLDEANNGPREAAEVARLIARAADAQAKAVAALRANPVVEDVVMGHEEESLARLEEALARASDQRREAENRQNQRRRSELRGKYEEALKQQLSIKDNVEGLAGQEQTRRTRAAARLAGQEQQTLRQTLEDLRRETAEIAEAKVFDFGHARLADLMGGAAGSLLDGTADATVVRRQASAARVLRSFVEALDDRKQPDDPFRKNEQQGGGGGGGGQQQQPLVPPAAEIVLLREMQREAAELTRAAAGATPDAAALKEAAQLQADLSRQGRDLLKRLSEEAEGGAPKPDVKPAGPEGADDKPADEPKGGGQ